MKRVVFGLRVIADGLTEDELSILLDGAPTSYITYPDIEFSDIFTFYGDSSNWTDDDYSETISFSVFWEKADGETVLLIPLRDITFRRNKLTTVTIEVNINSIDITNDNSNSRSINITNETTPMGEGENITIEAGE